MNRRIAKFLLLISLPVLAVLIWIIDRSINKFIIFPENFLTYLMQILGLVALSLLSLNFILSVKNRFIEKIIGGLDDQYKLHRRSGEIGFIIIVFHIAFGILRTLPSPNAFSLYLVPGLSVNYNLGIYAFWLLVLLIFVTLYVNLPYHIWKLTHRFMILPLILAGIHGYVNSYSPSTIPLISIFSIVVTIIGVVCFIYVEFLFYRIGPVYKYKVKELNQLKNVFELYVEPISKKIQYQAGQYIFLSFINNKQIKSELHPFAISTAPMEESRITAKNAGDYTNSLKYAKPGDIVKLIGPFGEFYSNNFPGRDIQVWIAGGIGITPFLSMLREEALKPTDKKIYLFYCTKDSQEAVYSEEVIELSKKISNLTLNFHCSNTEGFVNADYLKSKVGEDYSKSLFMICGPAPMMTSLQKSIMKSGVKKRDIFFENFSFK